MSTEKNNTPKKYGDYQDVENPLNSTNENLEEKWEVIKSDYRLKYPVLTDRDLTFLPNGFQKMTSMIASKTQRCNAEVLNEIRKWEI